MWTGKTAMDVRKRVMERLNETKKGNVAENVTQFEKKKTRKSGSDTIEFLREQSLQYYKNYIHQIAYMTCVINHNCYVNSN